MREDRRILGRESEMSSSVVERIDRVIKEIWLEDLKRDYFSDFLFREDCLKNCLYYHLRRRLGDGYLKARRIRVYTEYVLKTGERLDLAVVRLRPMKDMPYGYDIACRMEKVLSAIECKYKKGHVPTEPFLSDLRKIRRLSRRPELNSAQFYMATIHEREFPEEETTFVDGRSRRWAEGRFTDLSASYVSGGSGFMEFGFVSYNGMNDDMESRAQEVVRGKR